MTLNLRFLLLIFIALIISSAAGYLLSSRFRKGRNNEKVTLPRLKVTQNKEEATDLILRYLNESFLKVGKEIAVYEGVETREGDGWVFFWDSVDFIKTKDPQLGLKGSNPIFYNKWTGEITFLPPHLVLQYVGKASEETSSSTENSEKE